MRGMLDLPMFCGCRQLLPHPCTRLRPLPCEHRRTVCNHTCPQELQMPPQAVINSQQAFAASFAAWGATLHASSLTAAGLRPDDISASQELLASPAVTRLSVTLALYVWMHYLLHTHQADAAIMRGACGHVATLQVGRGKRRGRRPTAKGEHGRTQVPRFALVQLPVRNVGVWYKHCRG
jgi:hypothetical protein